MRKPEPIIVVELFAPLREGLVKLLESLSSADWERRTAAPLWSVKDVALHLLGDDLGLLSRCRDSFTPADRPPPRNYEELVALINTLNDEWTRASRRISPRVLIDLLRWSGPQAEAYFASLDPMALGNPVDWAGDGPAPVWLDIAREYTERWHHQQQIRDAVGKPGFTEPRFFAPVLDAFVRALPRTFRNVESPAGTAVRLTISGDAGGDWLLRREGAAWNLYLTDGSAQATARVTITQDDAWKLFTKGLKADAARSRAKLEGDESLALKTLETVSILG